MSLLGAVSGGPQPVVGAVRITGAIHVGTGASRLHAQEATLSTTNDWWAHDTSVAPNQREAVQAWGQLFAVPVVFTAIN